jgi:hypothetical protein
MALCKRFGEAIERCRERDWPAAAERFQGILDDFGDDGPADPGPGCCLLSRSGLGSRDIWTCRFLTYGFL